MRLFISLTAILFVLSGCNRKYKLVESSNPSFLPNSVFTGSEDISLPKFDALKKKYRLDTLFHNENDELKRILILRHWIHNTLKIDDYGPYPGDGSVENILDEGLKGHGFHCGHFMVVQNAILNAYGYVTRCLLADTGEPVDYMVGGGHHAINEVWLNSYQKWFLSDAKYDYHFEKNGIPLSALEIRGEYLKNKGADIILVKGPLRTIVTGLPEYNIRTKDQLAKVYTWLSWDKTNDRYSSWPNNGSDIIMYEDDYFKHHTWLWDGKPHWAYNTKFLHLVTERKKIEWTPNIITSKVSIKGYTAGIKLNSNTPNLATYQIKISPGTDWKNVPDSTTLELAEDTTEIFYRAVNLAGIAGADHKIIIAN
jgi:hypothetical protein